MRVGGRETAESTKAQPAHLTIKFCPSLALALVLVPLAVTVITDMLVAVETLGAGRG